MRSYNLFNKVEHAPQYDEYELSLAENVDQGLKQRFICHCIEHAIPKEHAQVLIDFLQEEQESILDNASTYSQNVLKELWGSRYIANMNRAKHALLAIDRKMDGRLVEFFEEGYGNHPVLIEMLSIIGSQMEEDSIAMPAKGFNTDKAMSTEEFLTKVVFK